MIRYLLDTNTLIVFQRAGHLDTLLRAAALVPMVIADDVHAELTVPRPGKPMTPELRQAARALSQNAIPAIEIDAGSAEDQARTALRRLNNAGAGEAGSIALAVRRLDLMFVTEDVKAVAGRAKLYRELPGDTGRVLGLHAFLRTLVERDALDESVALDVTAAARSWGSASCRSRAGLPDGRLRGMWPLADLRQHGHDLSPGTLCPALAGWPPRDGDVSELHEPPGS